MAKSGTFTTTLEITYPKSHPFNDASHKPSFQFSQALTEGTAAGQYQWVVEGTASVTASATQYDVSGSVTDIYGTAPTPSLMMGLIVMNEGTASGQDLTIGNAANHVPIFDGTSSSIDVPSGGLLALYFNRGVSITAGTGDIVRVSSSATVPYSYAFLVA